MFGFGKKSQRESSSLEAEFGIPPAGEETDAVQIRQLNEKVEKLTLICHALWAIVREKHGLDEQALASRIEEMKRLEGRACPQCGRVMSKNLKRCMYCGQNDDSAPGVFDVL